MSLTACLAAACAPPPPPRPNVLLVTLDTTRADRLGCYGNVRATSPNLDALAREAVLYTEARATSSWTLPALAALALLLAIGHLVAAQASPRSAGRALLDLEALALAPALGCGLASSITFLSLFFGLGPPRWWFFGALALALLAWHLAPGRSAGRSPVPRSPERAMSRPLAALAITTLAVAAVLFLMWNDARPDGRWDAYAIWNARARLLHRAPGDIATVLHRTQLGHPDYPLFLPAAIAAQFGILGNDSASSSALTSFSFLVGAGLLSFVLLRRVGPPALAAGGTALIWSTPFLVDLGQAQMADLPSGYLFLAALGGLALRLDRTNLPGPITTFAAASLALLAWTKNEGLVLAALLVILFVLCRRGREPHREGRQPPRQRALLAVGTLATVLPLSSLILFKLSWAPANDLLSQLQGEQLLHDLTDPERWLASIAGFATELINWPRWGLLWPLVAAIAACFLRRKTTWDALPARFMTLALAGAVLAWCSMYVATPRVQEWHMAMSLDRLLSQLAPAIVVWALSTPVRKYASVWSRDLRARQGGRPQATSEQLPPRHLPPCNQRRPTAPPK
ncbi:MAG: sulfatase-like hydrolase/transferase [Planctomycetota bacterium]